MELLFITLILKLFSIQLSESFSNSSADAQKAAKLPPCAACRALTDSFKKGMDRTARGKFEGGDSAWEEEKLGAYRTSEVRLVEVQEKLCDEIVRGQNQCHTSNEEYESLIENWWFNYQETNPSLYEWLCIGKLKVCCPNNFYGPKCLPCKGGSEIPCSGNGRCKGGGTRKGNGDCDCNDGYSGELCNSCASGHYKAYEDKTKVLCNACHKACQGDCTNAGPKSCLACKVGWVFSLEHGCRDVNECIADLPPCKINEFCINNEGSYKCLKCDRACDGCTGDGPDMCNKCKDGFELENGSCSDTSSKKREEHMVFARYVTYAGLTIATCIILQKHTVMAAIVGLFVASYITFSEYYLSHLTSEPSKGTTRPPPDPFGDSIGLKSK